MRACRRLHPPSHWELKLKKLVFVSLALSGVRSGPVPSSSSPVNNATPARFSCVQALLRRCPAL